MAENHHDSETQQGKEAGVMDTQARRPIWQTATARSSWVELGVHRCVKIAVIGVLFFNLFRNDIVGLVEQWVNDPSWSHGFLIPLFSLYFIHQRKKDILNLEARPNYLGLVLIICGIVFYSLNKASPSRYAYMEPITMIAVLGAVMLFLGGWHLVKYTWLPIFFLVFAVPLPQRYYVLLTMPMRKWAAAVATFLLNMVGGLQATAHGVVIDIVYRGRAVEPPLDVADACSGMRLLMAFVALGVAMAYLHYRPIWQRIILLAGTVPIAIFCNIVRVTVTGFIYVLINPKYAQGVYHDMLGLAMLPVAFGLYGFLAWFMASLFVEEAQSSAENVVVRRRKA
jgi:exosortase